MAWRAGRLRLGPTVVRPATLADVVALLTRTTAGDLPSARARRWAHRWLQLDGSRELRRALQTLVSAGVPQAEAHAVAAWQERLEQVRAEVVEAVGTGWPAHLPGVGRDVRPAPSPLPAPVVVPPLLSDRRFAQHAGFCAAGVPPDGRRRVDLFFDHSAFPVWWNGGGAMASPSNLAMPPDVAADLRAWSQAHGRRAVPGGEPHPPDAVGRHEGARLRLLAARLERTAGVAAVVQQHRGRGDGSCPTQGCLGPRP